MWIGWAWPDEDGEEQDKNLVKNFFIIHTQSSFIFLVEHFVAFSLTKKTTISLFDWENYNNFPGAFITWHAVAQATRTHQHEYLCCWRSANLARHGMVTRNSVDLFDFLLYPGFYTLGSLLLVGEDDGTTRWRGCEWARHNGTHDLIGGLIFRITMWMVHLAPNQTEFKYWRRDVVGNNLWPWHEIIGIHREGRFRGRREEVNKQFASIVLHSGTCFDVCAHLILLPPLLLSRPPGDISKTMQRDKSNWNNTPKTIIKYALLRNHPTQSKKLLLEAATATG